MPKKNNLSYDQVEKLIDHDDPASIKVKKWWRHKPYNSDFGYCLYNGTGEEEEKDA